MDWGVFILLLFYQVKFITRPEHNLKKYIYPNFTLQHFSVYFLAII